MSTVASTIESAEPTWQIAQLFPAQGHWSEYEYLTLNTNRLVEFSDGNVEVLEMPTELHQLIVAYLNRVLTDFVKSRGLGKVLLAPFRVRLWKDKIREPDVMFMWAENDARRTRNIWNGADLVMEVVSDDDPPHDLKTKREEYAQANIPEYWIVDPRDHTTTVLTLDAPGQPYVVAGKYAQGETAMSRLLEGFAVDVQTVFAQDD